MKLPSEQDDDPMCDSFLVTGCCRMFDMSVDMNSDDVLHLCYDEVLALLYKNMPVGCNRSFGIFCNGPVWMYMMAYNDISNNEICLCCSKFECRDFPQRQDIEQAMSSAFLLQVLMRQAAIDASKSTGLMAPTDMSHRRKQRRL